MSMNVELNIDCSGVETAVTEKTVSGKCFGISKTETSAPTPATLDCPGDFASSESDRKSNNNVVTDSSIKTKGQQRVSESEVPKLDAKSDLADCNAVSYKEESAKHHENGVGLKQNVSDQCDKRADKNHADKQDDSDDLSKNDENTDTAENKETQEYHLESFEQDGKFYVDYKDEDFATDSDFDCQSDTDYQEKASEEEGNKRKREGTGKNMGTKYCKRKQNTGAAASGSREDKCQGTSSEEETERPWRPKTRSSHQRSPKRKQTQLKYTRRPLRLHSLKRQWSDQDTQKYRDGYPGKKDRKDQALNLKFYRGEIKSEPDGAYIDDFHTDWWHNLDRLESHHGYIQWLFPIRESGMNFRAQELQLHEARAIQRDPVAMERFRQSYMMMLNFYGIRLVDQKTGKVERADIWKSRFQHLNHSTHNFLRITRILKSLGEMGLEHYKPPLLRFMLREAITKGTLDRTLDSCYNYWIGTVKDDDERESLKKMVEDSWGD